MVIRASLGSISKMISDNQSALISSLEGRLLFEVGLSVTGGDEIVTDPNFDALQNLILNHYS